MLSFSKLPLITRGVWEATSEGYKAHNFAREWRRDASVVVRVFKRRVQAGGAFLNVLAVIVRRKIII